MGERQTQARAEDRVLHGEHLGVSTSPASRTAASRERDGVGVLTARWTDPDDHRGRFLSEFRRGELFVTTSEPTQLVDLTASCERLIGESLICDGMMMLFCQHTTCGLLINENEEGFHDDLAGILEEIAAQNRYWAHDDMERRWQNVTAEERPNGHSHVRAAFIAHPSIAVPVAHASLSLGRWQRLFLVELDGGREREISVQLWGTVDRAVEDQVTRR